MTGRVSTARVARQGHPFLLAAAVSGAVLALMLLSIDAQATATGGYRLAGIVAVGKDYLGFLELPGGEQVLVRQGSTINGGGRIVALDGERLRIVFPDGTDRIDARGIRTARRGSGDDAGHPPQSCRTRDTSWCVTWTPADAQAGAQDPHAGATSAPTPASRSGGDSPASSISRTTLACSRSTRCPSPQPTRPSAWRKSRWPREHRFG